MSTVGILLMDSPGPQSISVDQGWSPGGNLWAEVCRKYLAHSYSGNKDCLSKLKLLKSLVPLLTSLLQKNKNKNDCVCETVTYIRNS